MKILHLSTSLTGGAGIAARRLANFQRSQGHEVEIISTKEIIASMPFEEKLSKSIGTKIFTLYNKSMTKDEYDSLTARSFNSVSKKEILSRKPSVVHLHNAYNLIDIPKFLELGSYVPIVATLHDERLVTGGCHVTLGCTNFRAACKKCPQASIFNSSIRKSQNRNREALQARYIPLETISPSHWLRNQILSASWTTDLLNVNVIPNMIDKNLNGLRALHAPDRFQVVIIAASESVNKGLSEAVEAMKIVAQNLQEKKFELMIIGGHRKPGVEPRSNLRVIQNGSVSTFEVRNILMQANLLLVASKSENSPNVISEAQLQKVPVLATRVGGIPEIIIEGETGFLCDVNASNMAERIIEIVEASAESIKILSTKAFDFANERHNPLRIHKDTLDIYAKAGASDK